jgi:hypothetical protein
MVFIVILAAQIIQTIFQEDYQFLLRTKRDKSLKILTLYDPLSTMTVCIMIAEHPFLELGKLRFFNLLDCFSNEGKILATSCYRNI